LRYVAGGHQNAIIFSDGPSASSCQSRNCDFSATIPQIVLFMPHMVNKRTKCNPSYYVEKHICLCSIGRETWLSVWPRTALKGENLVGCFQVLRGATYAFVFLSACATLRSCARVLYSVARRCTDCQ